MTRRRPGTETDADAARALIGRRLPDVSLPGTDGRRWRLGELDAPAVVFAYPRTGRPGVPPPVPNWEAIPGAAGCTAEACGFRDHAAEFRALGVAVFGLSTQTNGYQREMTKRLGMPFPALSDGDFAIVRALGLPTFEVGGETLARRLTMYLAGGIVEHVWYPVPRPAEHAADVLAWLLRGAPRDV